MRGFGIQAHKRLDSGYTKRNNYLWALWERLGVDKYPEPQMSEPQPQSEVPSMDAYMASLRGAISEYESGKSMRSAQAVKLQLAQELVKQEAWDDALRILRPLWHSMSWRREGWWDLTEEVGTILREVAVKAGDGGTVVAVDWELMSSSKYIIETLASRQALTRPSFLAEPSPDTRYYQVP